MATSAAGRPSYEHTAAVEIMIRTAQVAMLATAAIAAGRTDTGSTMNPVLQNKVIRVSMASGRLHQLSTVSAHSQDTDAVTPEAVLQVAGDDFAVSMDAVDKSRKLVLASSQAMSAAVLQPGFNASAAVYRWRFSDNLVVQTTYRLVSDTSRFVEKTLHLLGGRDSEQKSKYNITNVTLFDATSLQFESTAPTTSLTASSHYGLGDYAVFHRFGTGSHSFGAFLTAQNPYLKSTISKAGKTTISYFPQMIDNAAGDFDFDAGIVGISTLSGETLPPPALALDTGEQHAIVQCLREYLVVSPSPNSTVKVNVAWTENDFQLDIANPVRSISLDDTSSFSHNLLCGRTTEQFTNVSLIVPQLLESLIFCLLLAILMCLIDRITRTLGAGNRFFGLAWGNGFVSGYGSQATDSLLL